MKRFLLFAIVIVISLSMSMVAFALPTDGLEEIRGDSIPVVIGISEYAQVDVGEYADVFEIPEPGLNNNTDARFDIPVTIRANTSIGFEVYGTITDEHNSDAIRVIAEMFGVGGQIHTNLRNVNGISEWGREFGAGPAGERVESYILDSDVRVLEATAAYKVTYDEEFFHLQEAGTLNGAVIFTLFAVD